MDDRDFWLVLLSTAFFTGMFLIVITLSFDAKDGEFEINGERFVRVDAKPENNINNWERCYDREASKIRWNLLKDYEAFLDEFNIEHKCNFNYGICEYECDCFVEDVWRRC